MNNESFPDEDEVEVTRDDVDENGEVINALLAPNRHRLHDTQYVITTFKIRPHEYHLELTTETFLSLGDPTSVIIQASGYGEREVERLDQYSKVGIHHVARLTRIRWFPVEFRNKNGVLVLDCEASVDQKFARTFTSRIGSSRYKKWVGTKGFKATSFSRVKLTDVPLSTGELEELGTPGWAIGNISTSRWME